MWGQESQHVRSKIICIVECKIVQLSWRHGSAESERNNKIGATDTGYRPGRSISWWNVNPMRTDESQKAIICCPYLTLILQTPTFTPNHTESLSNDNVFPVRCNECQREDILKSTSGTAWANAIWQERICLNMPDPEVCGLTASWLLSLGRWAVCWSWRVDLARSFDTGICDLGHICSSNNVMPCKISRYHAFSGQTTTLLSLSNDNVFPVRCTECQREDILKSTSGTAWANAIWQERISLDMPDPEVCGLTAGWQLSLDRWAVCWSWRVDLARRSSEVVRYRYLWSGSYML